MIRQPHLSQNFNVATSIHPILGEKGFAPFSGVMLVLGQVLVLICPLIENPTPDSPTQFCLAATKSTQNHVSIFATSKVS